MPSTDAEVLALFLRLEDEYKRSLLEASDLDGDQLLFHRCRAAFAKAEQAKSLGRLTATTARVVHQVAYTIKTISRGLANVSSAIDAILVETQTAIREEIDGVYARSAAAEASLCGLDTGICALDTGTQFHPYRDYFLSHLGSPYPAGDDRDLLLSLVPSHDRAQLDNWFSNARRRSGWTAFRRDFALDSPIVLQNLLDNIDAPGNEEAKARLEGVKRYFDPEKELEVAEPLRELVQQGPKLVTPPKTTIRAEERLARRATRGVGAQGGSKHASPAMAESWSPRRWQRNPSSVAFSNSFNPDVDFYSNPTPVPLIEEPRYPSTFASPTSSLRSVSNASSSSLDSLISYGSSDYAPRIERMEPAPFQPYSLAPSAPSSGYSFPAPLPQLAHPAHVASETSRTPSSSFHSSTRAHPYFCTLSDLSHASSSRIDLPPLSVLSSTN